MLEKVDDLEYYKQKTAEFKRYLEKTSKRVNKRILHRFSTEMKEFFRKLKCQK